jgi:cold-inducible RNA-binding protein
MSQLTQNSDLKTVICSQVSSLDKNALRGYSFGTFQDSLLKCTFEGEIVRFVRQLSLNFSNMSKKLFVGNISWGVKTEGLRELFEQYGEVEDAVVITERHTGRSKGIGFVTFVNDEDADKALEALNGHELDGREINVDVARPPEVRD